MMLATHSQRLERWLSKSEAEHISAAMKDWYGPPIPLLRVPGEVYACGGGDFRGRVDAGSEDSLLDRADTYVRKRTRWMRDYMHRLNRSSGQARFGVANGLSDLVRDAAAGLQQHINVQKTGTTGVATATNTLWYVGGQPAAGSAGGAAPGGTAMSVSTTGALIYNNPTSPRQMNLCSAMLQSTAIGSLMMYDRLFSVTKTMNSTSNEAVSGTPSRYQSTTPGAHNSAEGNFLMIECRTVLAATAHNWDSCTYTDQSGNTGVTLPTVTGNSACIVNRLDQPVGTWFCPLASGDTGILALTNMHCSAAVATGNIDFTIGHPQGIIPCPVAGVNLPVNFYSNPLMFHRIQDSACLAFLELTKPATTAATVSGVVTLIEN